MASPQRSRRLRRRLPLLHLFQWRPSWWDPQPRGLPEHSEWAGDEWSTFVAYEQYDRETYARILSETEERVSPARRENAYDLAAAALATVTLIAVAASIALLRWELWWLAPGLLSLGTGTISINRWRRIRTPSDPYYRPPESHYWPPQR